VYFLCILWLQGIAEKFLNEWYYSKTKETKYIRVCMLVEYCSLLWYKDKGDLEGNGVDLSVACLVQCNE